VRGHPGADRDGARRRLRRHRHRRPGRHRRRPAARRRGRGARSVPATASRCTAAWASPGRRSCVCTSSGPGCAPVVRAEWRTVRNSSPPVCSPGTAETGAACGARPRAPGGCHGSWHCL